MTKKNYFIRNEKGKYFSLLTEHNFNWVNDKKNALNISLNELKIYDLKSMLMNFDNYVFVDVNDNEVNFKIDTFYFQYSHFKAIKNKFMSFQGKIEFEHSLLYLIFKNGNYHKILNDKNIHMNYLFDKLVNFKKVLKFSISDDKTLNFLMHPFGNLISKNQFKAIIKDIIKGVS